ncbi:unnamed protein product [Allacma fusca]|uniref:Fibronectin type-III domain-containing protein n=1 Tax=Allacma fusca TaxID=39272 RepID=A0A8J2P2V2_9HEXA|nr:unnamed protein product [Allacma fusca]
MCISLNVISSEECQVVMATEEDFFVFSQKFRPVVRRRSFYCFAEVFLIYVCIFSLSWTSKAEMVCMEGFQNFAGVTYPRGDIILQEGDPLDLYCSVNLTHEDVQGYNSSHLEFEIRKQNIPENLIQKSVLNETTILMHVDNMNASISFVECQIRKNDGTTKEVCQNHVEVGYQPMPVEDLRCVAWNWTKMICSWKRPYNPVTTTYNLTIYSKGFSHIPGYLCAKPNHNNGTFSCEWTARHDQAYRPNVKVYRVFINGTNALNKTGILWNHEFDHFSIVIPEPPKIHVDVNSTNKLLVNWTFHNFEHFPPGLDHEVTVCSEYGNCSTTILESRMSTFFLFREIDVPYAYTNYTVSIRMRSQTANRTEDFWSSPASTVARTLERIPDSPPRTDIGSFEVYRTKLEHRDIYVYWEKTQPSYRNGPGFHYEVLLYENNEPKSTRRIDEQYAYAKYDDLLDSATYRAEIYATNEAGRSLEKSTVMIPSAMKAPREPQLVSKLDYTNGTYVVTWSPPTNHEDIVSYTVFRCNRRLRAHQCNGLLEWDSVPADGGNKVIYHNLPHHEIEVYQFAVSANSADMSSGIVWASCSLMADKVPDRLKAVHVNATTEDQISITWELDCSYQEGVIDGFRIIYCQVNGDKKCDEGEKSAFTADRQTYTLKNLQPFSNYMIAVAVQTKVGESQRSHPIYGMTHEGVSDPPSVKASEVRNTSMLITIIPSKVQNGIIKEYKLWYSPNGVRKGQADDIRIDAPQNHDEELTYTLPNLTSNTNYSIQVAGCASQKCSEKSSPIYVITEIGATNIVNPPRLSYTNGNFKVIWNVPNHLGGPVNRFQVVVKQNGKAVNETKVNYKPGLSDYLQEIRMHCDSNTNLTAKVRAITRLENGDELYGDWSQDGNFACIGTSIWVTWVTVGVVLFFVVILVGVVAQKCWSCYKECSDFEPKLPPGLEKELYPCNPVPHKRKNSREDCQPFGKDSMTTFPLKYTSSTNLDEEQGIFSSIHNNKEDGKNLKIGNNVIPESIQTSGRSGVEETLTQYETNVVPWLRKVVACDDPINVNPDKPNTHDNPALLQQFDNVEDCLTDNRMSPSVLNPLLSDRSNATDDDEYTKSESPHISEEPYKKLGMYANGNAILLDGSDKSSLSSPMAINHTVPMKPSTKNDYINQRVVDEFSSPSPSTSSSLSPNSPEKNAATSRIVPDVLTNNSSYVKWTQMLPDFKNDAISNRQGSPYCQVGII